MILLLFIYFTNLSASSTLTAQPTTARAISEIRARPSKEEAPMLHGFEQKLARLEKVTAHNGRTPLTIDREPGFTQRDEKSLRTMIRALPDMLRQLALWSRDPSVPHRLRRLHLFTLAYLHNPDDILPEKALGFWGYLDDAYMTTSAIVRTMEQSAPLGLHPLWDTPGLTLRTPEWLNTTQQFFPEVTERVDNLLDHCVSIPGTGKNPPRPLAGPHPRNRRIV
jgi:uncharacterized membrane protein YkvA (DUF1232 family)